MLLAERDSEQNLTRDYVLGNEYVGQRAVNGEAQSSYYYITDEQGSVRYVLNQAGEVENYYQYEAFGKNIMEEADVFNRLCYNSQMQDELSGLYYLRARYYNPYIGRFTQEDVIYQDGLNLYAYCASNPVVYCDPSGFNKCENAGGENSDMSNVPNAGKPGSPSWKSAKNDIKDGKGINYQVGTEEEARRLLQEARGGLPEYDTYTRESYKFGFEVHPAEPDVGNYLPHIKWKDWSNGKSNGANGHIFFGGN